VSPTYAREIQREPLGMGLQGLLAHRAAVLTGILNGIDTDAWDPETDPYIAKYYNATRLPVKAENKRVLQEKLGLTADEAVPLVGLIGRFTDQKGFDLVLECAAALVRMPVQLAVLGSGERACRKRSSSSRAPIRQGRRGVGHESAAPDRGRRRHLPDAIALRAPQLEQMYSQRYGTPVVAHATGGLVDSIVDCTAETIADKTATGFLFSPMTRQALLEAVTRAVRAYGDKKLWRQLQKNGMARDFSWEASAAQYVELYASLVAG
jgi:starch synthase